MTVRASLALFSLLWATGAQGSLALAGATLAAHEVSLTFGDGHVDLVLHHGASADHGCGRRASAAEISTPLHHVEEHHVDHVVHLCGEAPFVSTAFRADLGATASWVIELPPAITNASRRADRAPDRPPAPDSAISLHRSIVLLA